MFVHSQQQRKDFEQSEIVILLTHMINHYNPVQFNKFELMNNEMQML